MTARVELADGNVLIRILENGSTVVVEIAVIRRGENRDHRWELFRGRFAVHLIPVRRHELLVKFYVVREFEHGPLVLHFMSTNYSQEAIALEEITRSFISVRRFLALDSVHGSNVTYV